MTIVLSSINLKGGVGKTTMSVNFAAYCGLRKLRTLLIDLDPQTNATFSTIGVEKWEQEAQKRGTIADLLGARSHVSAEGAVKTAREVLCKDVFTNVDLIPSHLDLFTVDLDLAGATARERKLAKALKPIENEYDIIICDCPPNLTLPTQNALAISTHYVVPVSLDFLSTLGIGILLSRVGELSNDLDQPFENAGIVISRVGRPAQHRAATEASIRAAFTNLVLVQTIKERSDVSEAAERRVPIFSTGNSTAIAEFNAVFDELADRIGLNDENP
jgi:chromosome partitioning protein